VAPKSTIRIRDLQFRYRDGDFALRIPGLCIHPGERVAVIGPSGSGKTTLLHLVAGIATPEAGRIQTAGTELVGLDDAARRAFRVQHVGLVFQEFELLDYLTVLENVLLPYRMHPALHLDASVRQRAIGLTDRVGIADKLTRLPTKLSHGERQRVAVCRALVTQPELVLADEPTGNLDPANRDRVLEILIDCVAETGATLLTVTHDRDLLPRFDRVIDFATLCGGKDAR
jgi:putative ABC transport system ATP-binding protein